MQQFRDEKGRSDEEVAELRRRLERLEKLQPRQG